MSPMDLNQLAEDLRAQANHNSTIVLGASVFAEATVREAIRAAFALDDEADFTISEVQASDIPDPADGVLTIAAGTTSVLKQKKVRASLTFISSNDDLQAIIVTEMEPKWTFKDSFGGLDRFPFKFLEPSHARFVYATAAQSEYAWPGDADTKIELAEGLNFLSQISILHLTKSLKALKSLIGETSATRKFYGPLTLADGQTLPAGKLTAPLDVGPLVIGDSHDRLTLSGPTIAVEIEEPSEDSPTQRIDLLVEGRFQEELQIAAGIPLGGGSLEISTQPLSPDRSIDSLIRRLPGGENIRDYIPQQLSQIFAEVGLDNFSLIVSPEPKVTYLSFSLSTVKPWSLISGVLELKHLRLEVQTIEPSGFNLTQIQISATAEFLRPSVFDGDFEFSVELEKPPSQAAVVKTISGAYHGTTSLGKIVRGIAGNGGWVPPALNNIEFSDFGITVNREGQDSTYSFYGAAEAAFPILDTSFSSTLRLAVTKTTAATEIELTGDFVIGEQVFSLNLDLGKPNSQLTFKWENQGTPLGFGDIASAFGWDSMPEVPEGLDLALKEAKFTYDFTDKTVTLTAQSANYGQIVFASLSLEEKRVYVFSLDIPLDLKFSDLPLVGESLRIDPPVGVSELQINVASADLAEESIETLNGLLETPLIPKEELRKGVTIAANIEMNGPQAIELPLSSRAEKEDGETVLRGEAPTTALMTTGANYQTEPKWFPLKKTLGPVHFDKVGVQYQNATLRFLLNAAFSAAGLTLTVDGLSVGSSLKKFKPEFDLRGLGIEYKAGDVEIGGAFLRTTKPGQEDSYDGAAVIKTKQVAISALGSYTKVNGEPSLFIYAFLDYPLGGPAFFFVTGLAAGFGYNRKLIAPSIDNVAQFPLVKQALGGRNVAPKDVMDALKSLQAYVPPSSGSIFLALGVKFNSFKLIDSFALLTLEFGDKLAVNLIGLSTAIVPTPEAGKTVTPLAQVQIAWKATYDPDEGCLAIDARLTPNSYILSKDCRLSGGYAFYSWFAGPHAGDFVQTLGGYHPAFEVPKHYPRVPRLAFDWRVSNSLTIQGDAYYALTGSALMAGGHLEVLYRQGELRAWLKVGADFLIAWKPYHYDARLYVNVGASYTFDINLLFGHVRCTISVDVGAQLHLWGPDFSGTARIDLSVISFTIAFGAGASQTPAPIKEWASFQQSFLPAKNVCSVAVKAGLVRNIQVRGEERWVINPKQFALVVDSAVPFKTASLQTKPNEKLVKDANVSFGVGPMAITAAKLDSDLIVAVKRGNEPVDDKFNCSVIKKKVPAGLWGESASPKLNGNNFLDRVPAGIEITPGDAPKAGSTTTVDVKRLSLPETPHRNSYAWGPAISFKPSSDEADARDAIRTSVGSSARRSELLAELGLDIKVNIRDKVADDFVSAPQIGNLYANGD